MPKSIEKICSCCGAKYELFECKSIMRDKDSLECDFCGTVLIKWNGGCFFTDKLISAPTNKEYIREKDK